MTIEELAHAIEDLECRIDGMEYGDSRDTLEAEHEELLDSYVSRVQ